MVLDRALAVGEVLVAALRAHPAAAHVDRLRELAEAGVDQFALYLMHDQQEQTLAAYRSEVIAALG